MTGRIVIGVTLGILLAVVVLFAVVRSVTANDAAECANANARRSLEGLPAQAC